MERQAHMREAIAATPGAIDWICEKRAEKDSWFTAICKEWISQ